MPFPSLSKSRVSQSTLVFAPVFPTDSVNRSIGSVPLCFHPLSGCPRGGHLSGPQVFSSRCTLDVARWHVARSFGSERCVFAVKSGCHAHPESRIDLIFFRIVGGCNRIQFQLAHLISFLFGRSGTVQSSVHRAPCARCHLSTQTPRGTGHAARGGRRARRRAPRTQARGLDWQPRRSRGVARS